jgi:hypothetical protein
MGPMLRHNKLLKCEDTKFSSIAVTGCNFGTDFFCACVTVVKTNIDAIAPIKYLENIEII